MRIDASSVKFSAKSVSSANFSSKSHFQMFPFDTEYDRAKVPPYNRNDPPPAPGSLKALLFPPLLNNVENKGMQGVRARYGADLPPFISTVRYPGRPVILGMDPLLLTGDSCKRVGGVATIKCH